jgi:hypothetical protein
MTFATVLSNVSHKKINFTRAAQLESWNLVSSLFLMYAYCCQVYYPVEQDIGKGATRLRAITDLFSSIIEEPCFDQLRYKYHTLLLR